MNNIADISEIIYRLRGSQIQKYTLGSGTLRLVLFTSVSNFLKPPSACINLVLTPCPEIYYLSYTQVLEARIAQHDLEQIFGKGLMIQGVEQTSKTHLIIYCNSYQNTLEAGELHLEAANWQLYDAEFGRISFAAFCQASDKSGYPFK